MALMVAGGHCGFALPLKLRLDWELLAFAAAPGSTAKHP